MVLLGYIFDPVPDLSALFDQTGLLQGRKVNGVVS